MAKKSGINLPEVKKWLNRVKHAESLRNDADERFGYSRSLKEYAGDYKSAMPSFMRNTPLIPINEVYGFAKVFIPSVYSRNPHIAFNGKGRKSIAPAKLLELGVNAYWRELRLKRQVRRCIFDAIFAEGWFKTGYSAAFGSIEPEDGDTPLEANEFVRDEEIFGTRVSWRHMVRDPDAVDGIHDARFVAQKIIKPLEAVQASSIYTAKDIRATHSYDPNYETVSKRKNRTIPGDELEEYIEFWEVWDMDTAKIFWVSDGCDEYLRDPKKWPYRFNGYPYDLLRFNQLEDETFAPNMISPWEPQLWEKIKIRSMQMDHIKRFNRQMWAKKGSVSTTEMAKFALGQTGAINEYEGDIPPVPSQYPQIQTDIYGVENRIDTDKDNISGQPNAVRSAPQKTQSRTLGEVKSMVSAFQARQVDPQSDVEDFCGEIATKIAAVMQDFLPAEKLVQVTQEDMGVIVQAFGSDRFDGRYFKFKKKDIAGAEFDTEVRVGSTLPLDREGRLESITGMVKLGASLGIGPMSKVSQVIGKNFFSEMDIKEITLAYEEMLAEMAKQEVLAKASARMQMDAMDQKLARAKGLIQSGNGDIAGMGNGPQDGGQGAV